VDTPRNLSDEAAAILSGGRKARRSDISGMVKRY
jgi:hypothetical protein